MADEKMVTEREAVLRERKAFVAGVVRERNRSYLPPAPSGVIPAHLVPLLDEIYPLPVKKRPLRVKLTANLCRYAYEPNEGKDGHPWALYQPGAIWADSYLPFSSLPICTEGDFRRIQQCLDGAVEDVPEGEE